MHTYKCKNFEECPVCSAENKVPTLEVKEEISEKTKSMIQKLPSKNAKKYASIQSNSDTISTIAWVILFLAITFSCSAVVLGFVEKNGQAFLVVFIVLIPATFIHSILMAISNLLKTTLDTARNTERTNDLLKQLIKSKRL